MFPISPSSDVKLSNPMYVPVGAASPLWFMFAGSAVAGMAFWWMTRWPNLYASLETKLAEPPGLPVPAPAPEPPAVLREAVAETVAVAEKLAEPAADAGTTLSEAIAEATDTVTKPKAVKKVPSADDPPLTH